MKKTILFAALAAVAMSASAQWFDFKNNVHRYEIGLNLGVAGMNSEFRDFGIGASVSAWGVYLDFITAGPMYKHDSRVASMNDPVDQRLIPDSTTTAINIGYQIPVLPWLRVMPLVGVNVNTSGYTDMSRIETETSSSDDYTTVNIVHPYDSERTWTSFNFGGGLVVSPFMWLSVYGVYTTNAIYGGITVNLSGLFEAIEGE